LGLFVAKPTFELGNASAIDAKFVAQPEPFQISPFEGIVDKLVGTPEFGHNFPGLHDLVLFRLDRLSAFGLLTGSSTGNAPLSRPKHLTGYEQTSWNR
jgi:hypothetical protein